MCERRDVRENTLRRAQLPDWPSEEKHNKKLTFENVWHLITETWVVHVTLWMFEREVEESPENGLTAVTSVVFM